MGSSKHMNSDMLRWQHEVDDALPKLLPRGDDVPERLSEAVRYAVMSGGKRIRPTMTLAVAELLGASAASVMKGACGIELVHTSSLLLDDLPCMDDHATRRGKPSTHRAFDESTAILASVALLAQGFDLIAQNGADLDASADRVVAAVREVSLAVGAAGMSGGQQLDLAAQLDPADLATLLRIHRQKTAVLFAAAMAVPAWLLGAPRSTVEAMRACGEALGEAFQVSDDILDADEARGAADGHSQRANLLRALDVSEARRLLVELIDSAKRCLAPLDAHDDLLFRLADIIRDRTG